MRTRTWAGAALLCFLAAAGAAPAAEPRSAEPGFVVQIKSLDGVLGDGAFVARAMGKDREETFNQFQKALLAQAGPKGLKGFDRTRPIGVYGYFGQDALDSPSVAMIPVKDEDDVLALLEGFGMKADKGEDGVYTVPAGLAPVYFRFANHYAYVAVMNKSVLDKDKLLAPTAVFTAGEKALLTATAHLDRVPEGLKKKLLDQAEEGISKAKEQTNPNETPAQKQIRDEMTREVSGLFTAVIQEGRNASVRVEVDRTANQLLAEARFDARPGSKLAERLEQAGKGKSLFTGLVEKQPAVGVLAHLQLTEQAVQALLPSLEEEARKDRAKEQDRARREANEKLFNALLPTFKAGELDFGLAVRRPAADKGYTAVLGFQVKDGQAVDKALREVVEAQPPEQRNKVHFDAAKVGGVSVHRIDLPAHADEQSKKLLGPEPEAYVAVRPDAVLITAGQDALAAMKEAIALEPGAARPFVLKASARQLVPVLERLHPGAPQVAEEALKEGQDRVQVVVEGGPALRLTVRLNPEVLNFGLLLRQGRGAPRP